MSYLGKLLESPRARELLDLLNRDGVYGPHAPGDGDIVEWYASVALISMPTVSKLASQYELAAPDEARKYFDETCDGENDTLQEKRHLVTELQKMGKAIFLLYYPSPSRAQLSAWKEVSKAISNELGEQWGRRKVRISVNPKRRKNVTEIVRSELLSGTNIQDIPKKCGVGKSSVYRVLKKTD